MTYRIELHTLALQELQESYDWYEERGEGLGTRFLTAVQKKFDGLSTAPKLYAKRKGNYRETTVKDFPFTIVYEVLEKQNLVFISYVFHSKRNPGIKYKR